MKTALTILFGAALLLNTGCRTIMAVGPIEFIKGVNESLLFPEGKPFPGGSAAAYQGYAVPNATRTETNPITNSNPFIGVRPFGTSPIAPTPIVVP